MVSTEYSNTDQQVKDSLNQTLEVILIYPRSGANFVIKVISNRRHGQAAPSRCIKER